MRNNTWVVLEREYLTRVKKKTFLITTFVMPLLMVALMFLPAILMNMGGKGKDVAFVDETGLYADALRSEENRYMQVEDTATAKAGLHSGDYDAVLFIPAGSLDSNRQNMYLFYEKNEPGMSLVEEMETAVQNKLRMNLMSENAQVDPALFGYINGARAKVETLNMQTGEKSFTAVKSILALVAGFLIYMFIFLFGNQIMSGVIEEKSSRIIEVMISSVKPFQLLMGKVLGLALVGLTQLLLWVGLTAILTLVIGLIGGAGAVADAAQMASPADAAGAMGAMVDAAGQNAIQEAMSNVREIVASLHLRQLLGYFMVYFIGGYLLYASMFAAVGSAVENQEDTNQLMWPITIPLLVAILALTTVMKDPYSQLAVWTSIIPFTSPVVMLARIPFGVPVWELALSIGLLVLTFVASIWVAARIYRVGILMYGKKGSYKELWRWLWYKG